MVRKLQANSVDYIHVQKDSSFGDGEFGEHVRTLARLLFERPRDVAGRLGDAHWFHALLSWYHLLDEHVIGPAIADGHWVVSEVSPQKIAARYTAGGLISSDVVAASMRALKSPDVSILLDIDPQSALARRGGYTPVEAGGTSRSAEDLLTFQGGVANTLRTWGRERDWHTIDATSALPFHLADQIISEANRRSTI